MKKILILAGLLFLCSGCGKKMDVSFQLKTKNDNKFYVGISRVDIMPILFNEDGSCPEGKFCFETYKNLGTKDGCPDNKDNYFEGLMNKPEGEGCKEPFFDSNKNGFFDGLWLGGYNIARAATDYDRDVPIYVNVLIMSYNDEYVVLIILPFVGFPTLQLSFLRERISAISDNTITKKRIIPMVQHNHGVPDTQGLWGPDLLRNYGLKIEEGLTIEDIFAGFKELFDRVEFPLPALNYRNNDYWFWVEDRVIEAIKIAIESRKVAKVKFAVKETPHRETGCQNLPFEGEVKIDCNNNGVFNEGDDISIYAGGNVDGDCLKKGYEKPVRFLVEDLRMPFSLDYNVYTMQFLSEDEKDVIGTFIVWGHHVEEADRENTKVTSDLAGYACEYIERKVGGICIFQIGPEGGLTSTNSGAIPFVDKDGYFYDCKGNKYEDSNLTDDYLKYLDDGGELKFENINYEDAISAGRVVAKTSLKSLENEKKVYNVKNLNLRYLYGFLPMDNPFFYLGGKIELMTGMSLLLRKDISKEDAGKIKDIVFKNELSKDNFSCGGAICIRTLFNFINIELNDNENKTKKIGIATAPGELFPEYLVGRKKSSFYYQEIDSKEKLKEMGDISKDPDYPKDIFSPDINPQKFVEIKGLKEVAKELGYDEYFILAQANSSFGYMMPREDYLPVFEGYFDLIVALLPLFDWLMVLNEGLYKIYKLPDNDKNLKFSDVIYDTVEKYKMYVENYTPPSGKDVNVMNHPNSYEETVSMGPRTGDIVFNAIYGLMTKGSYEPKIPVPYDPNLNNEILSLNKEK